MSAAEYISDCRISPRGGEHGGRRRVQEYEGPLRLDVEPPHLQAVTGADEAIGKRPVHVLSDETIAKILQLEAKPRGREHRSIQPGWSKVRGLANPPWCLIACLLS